jgi:hypothetical protein
MIDDYAKAMELMHKMEAHLPIPAHATGALIRLMRDKGIKLARDQELQIQDVFYFGDEGGISCNVTPSRDAKEVLIASLTHLRIDPRHPLAREIRVYQRERTRGIAQAGGSAGVHHLDARPSKKRRR